MNTLLHICCAPCALYPVEVLKKEAHRFAGFFYNPNIHPYSEYLKRKLAARALAKDESFNIIYPDYDFEKYFQYVTYNEKPADRCPVCWWMRIEKAARYAAENGFDAFTTTLLGSPYQDHDVIKNICVDVASRSGIKFYYNDFRPGFKDAQKKAASKGYYRQNYCGCIFSEKERIDKSGNDL